jgi:hypothetical protein
MKALKRAGQTTELAVAQTEAEQAIGRCSVLSIEQQISEMGEIPFRPVGYGSAADKHVLRLTTSVSRNPFQPELPLQLLHRRPDIRKRKLNWLGLFMQRIRHVLLFIPLITLRGSAGWTKSAGGAITNPGQWLLSAGRLIWFSHFSIADRILLI